MVAADGGERTCRGAASDRAAESAGAAAGQKERSPPPIRPCEAPRAGRNARRARAPPSQSPQSAAPAPMWEAQHSGWRRRSGGRRQRVSAQLSTRQRRAMRRGGAQSAAERRAACARASESGAACSAKSISTAPPTSARKPSRQVGWRQYDSSTCTARGRISRAMIRTLLTASKPNLA